jgi:ABC-2 type transport system ATP-binding protein
VSMAIFIDHIRKSFDRVRALEQVSFEVADSEMFGLIGPDGAGKSTLFRIMASLLTPDSGTCRVQGYDVVSQYRDVRRIIGYMPGRFSLYMDLTVEENLAFYARVFGTSVSQNYDLVREVYQHIEPFRKRKAGKLSGGMKQKLALSCALIHRPEVLILDEPTTGVDAVSRREFWEMLKKIRGEGITIVVSTPYMDEVVLCDRVALIQKGSLLDITDPSRPIREMQGRIYSLCSEKGVHAYLERLRKMEQCESVWLFGDELHVTLRNPDDGPGLEAALEAWEDPTLSWKRSEPTIEDRFLALMQPEER